MPMITAGDLSMEVSLHGPKQGKPLLLIHGWPDDASTWDQVAPALAAEGFRVIVPTLRGFGATRFANDDISRTGNSAMLAIDMITLLDALGIDRFMVAGHDWGSNTAEALAVGWPERVERMAMLSTRPGSAVCRRRHSSRPSGNGITGSWRPRAGRRRYVPIGAGSPICIGSTGRHRDGSTRRRSTVSLGRSTIPTGPT
jgi:pimeloyl-ACP methyl ester carboxylesterase